MLVAVEHERSLPVVLADRLEDLADLVGEVRPQVAVAEVAADLAQVGRGARRRSSRRSALAARTQHLVELVVADRRHEDLVLDAAEEGLVAEARGLEVGREHDLGVERDLELQAVAERQVVDAAVERDDPAVEELLGGEAVWRPKSSMTRMPLLACIWSGAR